MSFVAAQCKLPYVSPLLNPWIWQKLDVLKYGGRFFHDLLGSHAHMKSRFSITVQFLFLAPSSSPWQWHRFSSRKDWAKSWKTDCRMTVLTLWTLISTARSPGWPWFKNEATEKSDVKTKKLAAAATQSEVKICKKLWLLLPQVSEFWFFVVLALTDGAVTQTRNPFVWGFRFALNVPDGPTPPRLW